MFCHLEQKLFRDRAFCFIVMSFFIFSFSSLDLEAFDKFCKSNISIDNILGASFIWLILGITVVFLAAVHDSRWQKGNGNHAMLTGNVPSCVLAPGVHVLTLNCPIYSNSHGTLKVGKLGTARKCHLSYEGGLRK